MWRKSGYRGRTCCDKCGGSFYGVTGYWFTTLQGQPVYCERCFHAGIFGYVEWSEETVKEDDERRRLEEANGGRGWGWFGRGK